MKISEIKRLCLLFPIFEKLFKGITLTTKKKKGKKHDMVP